jgi:hypothetical protein
LTQLIVRLEDFGLVAVPPVGALMALDWASDGCVPFVTDAVHVDAPAMPADPRTHTTVASAR